MKIKSSTITLLILSSVFLSACNSQTNESALRSGKTTSSKFQSNVSTTESEASLSVTVSESYDTAGTNGTASSAVAALPDNVTSGESGITATVDSKTSSAVSSKATPSKITSSIETSDTVTSSISETSIQSSAASSAAKVTHTLITLEKQVVDLVNKIRDDNGLSTLTINIELSQVAKIKSQDMIDKKYFDHNSPTYGSPFDMMKTFGISYIYAGENIAMGYPTAEEVVDGWMNSPSHKANILNPNFDEIGVGYVSADSQNTYWTQMFTGH